MSPTPPSLLLFARAPEAGRVKTRLEPALGAKGAARLYRAFLEDAARCYGPPAPWAAVLCADPDPVSPLFSALFPAPWRGQPQAAGDLGARLCAAFQQEFRRGAPAAVAVGSDHPALPRPRLAEMFERLSEGVEAVLIPAQDGGYCAIGLSAKAPVEPVFREIPWSSPHTLAVTLERLDATRVSRALLPASYDVDRPEDLARLRAEVAARDPSEPDYPSATAAALESLEREGAF
ncbi:MAG: TIGR04282 family arsenosugar biosynthesis glycosyltransferase [Thermoanaerobaculia bacterium]